MASTIHDVARLAGVHASTVSRVLNGKSAITDRTRERVYAAMKQLDYHPNSMARSLASGLAGMIGLVLDTADESSFHNADFSSSQFAIERVAQAHGYHLVIANGAHLAAGAVQALVLERKVDGLILPPSGANLSLLSRLDRFPCVMLGQPAGQYPDASWVDIDNELGAVMAVRHLLSRGYASVGFLGSQAQETMDFVGRRVRGYYRALPPGARAWVCPTDGTPEDACRAAMACLREEKHPRAFVCNDNFCAFGLLRAAAALGLRIPEDLGVVTFNDYPLAAYTDPPLTAVHIDTTLMGERTAELLFQHIGREARHEQILLPPSLIVRASSGREE